VSGGALLFVLAYALGFLAAIPVGGSQIEVAKRAIAGERVGAGLVIVGSVSSDLVYGVIALVGIAPIMERPGVLAGFDVADAALLWLLGVATLRRRDRVHLLGKARAALAGFYCAPRRSTRSYTSRMRCVTSGQA